MDQVRRLQQAIQTVFPDCDELRRLPAGFTAHLSVGQFDTVAKCQQVATKQQTTWQSLTFSLTAIALLTRQGEAPFVIERKILLGGPTTGRGE
jgi:hypothetical protein